MEDADITLRSDHLPLKKFLAKITLNSKVNNWAMEISPFRITFEYIKGIKNTLADTMSRLININPQVQQESDPEGNKFRYYTFDTLPALEVSNIETTKIHLYVSMIKIIPTTIYWNYILIMIHCLSYNKKTCFTVTF